MGELTEKQLGGEAVTFSEGIESSVKKINE